MITHTIRNNYLHRGACETDKRYKVFGMIYHYLLLSHIIQFAVTSYELMAIVNLIKALQKKKERYVRDARLALNSQHSHFIYPRIDDQFRYHRRSQSSTYRTVSAILLRYWNESFSRWRHDMS